MMGVTYRGKEKEIVKKEGNRTTYHIQFFLPYTIFPPNGVNFCVFHMQL